MVNYRRNRLRDGRYFFTVTLKDRKSDLLIRHIDALRQSWQRAAELVRHEIIAAVVLPDHLHALIALHDGDDNYPKLWQELKKGFTRRLDQATSPWQSRYWEHTIRNDLDFQTHFDYIHINPVKHRLVARVADWPHSSFHRYVKRGELPKDWAGKIDLPGRFGEPR